VDRSEVANSLAADILVIKGRVLPPAIMEHVTRLPDQRRNLGETLTRRQGRHQGERIAVDPLRLLRLSMCAPFPSSSTRPPFSSA
jgi:hypothetical protein